MHQTNEKGFTLLELLIVIAIMAILAAVAIFVLNPAETLRETRDSQRLSDLATIKTAIALYITKATSTIQLDNASNATCKNGSGEKTIYYSLPNTSAITDITLDGSTFTAAGQTSSADSSLVDGNGWIKVNLSGLIGGSPISDMPIDPSNSWPSNQLSSITAGNNDTHLSYRYACDYNDNTFEINANLESDSLGTRETRDGGNNNGLYETGTKLTILGTGVDF